MRLLQKLLLLVGLFCGSNKEVYAKSEPDSTKIKWVEIGITTIFWSPKIWTGIGIQNGQHVFNLSYSDYYQYAGLFGPYKDHSVLSASSLALTYGYSLFTNAEVKCIPFAGLCYL